MYVVGTRFVSLGGGAMCECPARNLVGVLCGYVCVSVTTCGCL